MSWFTINSLLTNAVANVPAMPEIVAENTLVEREYDSSIRNTPYVRTFLIPSQTIVNSLGINGYDLYNGIFQINIYTPYNDGTNYFNALADRIISAMPRDTILVDGSICVRIKTITRYGSTTSSNWWMTPVEIEWECFIQRSA